MKKLGVTLLVLSMICFFGTSNIFAEPVQKHTWGLGGEISNRLYDEPGVMDQEGIMYGVFGSYTYRGNVMLRAEGLFSFGQVDYKNSGTMNDIDDYVLEFRGLVGYDFPASEDKVITPYIGIGHRYLNDDMGGRYSSTGAFGYERESTYIYSPIGIEATYVLENGWSIGVTGEYDYFWEGTQKSNLGWQPGYWDVENDQEEGYGLRGSIKIKKESERVNYVIEPFIRYWDIENSETTTDPGGTSWIEPTNTTQEIGIKFAAEF